MICFTLRDGASILAAGEDSVTVGDHDGRVTLGGVTGLAPALRSLESGPVDLDGLAIQAGAGGPQVTLTLGERRRLAQVADILAAKRLIEFQCVVAGRQLMTAVPAGPLCLFRPGPPATAPGPTARAAPQFLLSRFACLRRVGRGVIIDCPHRSVQGIVCLPEAAAVALAFAAPASAGAVAGRFPRLPEQLVGECVRFLLGIGAIGQVGSDGHLPEDTDLGLRQREFHDVLMHAKSRNGLSGEVIGATFPFAGAVRPSPAVKEVRPGEVIRLARPDLEHLIRTDPPLAKVMEERRSVRHSGAQPVTAAQLGEFLYRVARVRSVRPADPGDPRQYETTDRPSPSGGAAHDLEIYPVVSDCAGLRAGLYHYEAGVHGLTGVPAGEKAIRRLLQDACSATGGAAVPQVLLVLTSRFSRLTWKYRGMSYATTLRNVGVLYEAMYLAATAMGLAPCALGCGDSAAFGAAAGLDPLAESSVGEFMLGSAPVITAR